jgi:MFS family permease
MDAPPCQRFVKFTQYAKDLEEAYRTRATQNRTWLYVAGITGLAVAAASGGLAAATAVAAGTLALLSISGGFTAGAFATINNTQLANVYDDAAKEIGTAVATAEAAVFGAPQPAGPAAAPVAAPAAAAPAPPAPAQPAPVQPALAGAAVPAKVPPPSDAVCATHLSELINTVSEARNKLDTARTDSAEGALIRATAGQAALKDIVAAQTPKDITGVKLPGQITKIDNVAGTFRVPTGGKLVPLTVTNAPLDQAVPADIKIALGSKVFDMAATFPTKKGTHEYDVMLQIPATPPDGDSVKTYVPAIVVEKGKKRIPAAPGLTIVYP